MARIIDEGWVDKDDPMFTEGVKIISIRKQGEPKKQESQPLGEGETKSEGGGLDKRP